jgi:HK97 family phage prohead protease
MSDLSRVVYDPLGNPPFGSDQSIKAARGGIISIDRKEGIVEAFVAAIGNKDSVNDIIQPGAFNGSLKRRQPRAVWGHDWNSPIGKVLEIYEVPPGDTRLPEKMRRAGVGGLYAKIQFNLKSKRGQEAFNDVEFFGEDQQWSIGYKTLRSTFDPHRKANLLHEVELYEVSPVLHGANHLTGTISVKGDELNGNAITVSGSNGTTSDVTWSYVMDNDVGEYDFLEGKAGRVVANRNMAKLRQVIDILQSIMAESDPEMMEKTAYVEDYEKKSAQEFGENEVLIYGDTEAVRGVTLGFSVTDRKQVTEVLTAANDLVCCKGFLVQLPHSEEGGEVKFYLPAGVDAKDAITALAESMENVSFEVKPNVLNIAGYTPTDSIPVKKLFTEPTALNEDED